MLNFQTFIALVTALLVFITSVFLAYDTLQFRNYTFIIPQWAGLSLVGITFSFVAVDQILRGFIRLEEVQRQSEDVQRRTEEKNFRAEEEQRRISETRSREREIAQAESRRLEERDRVDQAAEREARRARIEARYRAVLLRFLLDDTPTHRRQVENMVALLEEYQDTL